MIGRLSRTPAPRPLARRLTVVGATVLAATLASTAPALAQTVRNDGEDPGVGYTPLQAILLFVVIPLGVIVLTTLAVYAPSWTRSGRSSASFDDDPVLMSSPHASTTGPAGSGAAITGGAPGDDPGSTGPGGSGDHSQRGGTSAGW